MPETSTYETKRKFCINIHTAHMHVTVFFFVINIDTHTFLALCY